MLTTAGEASRIAFTVGVSLDSEIPVSGDCADVGTAQIQMPANVLNKTRQAAEGEMWVVAGIKSRTRIVRMLKSDGNYVSPSITYRQHRYGCLQRNIRRRCFTLAKSTRQGLPSLTPSQKKVAISRLLIQVKWRKCEFSVDPNDH